MDEVIDIDELNKRVKENSNDSVARLNLAIAHLKKGNKAEAFKHFTETKHTSPKNSKENKLAHKFAHEIAHQLEEPDLTGLGLKEFIEMVEQFRLKPTNDQLKSNILILSKSLDSNDPFLQNNNYILINQGFFKENNKSWHHKNIILTHAPVFSHNYALEKARSIIVCGGTFEGNSALFEIKKVSIFAGEFNGEFALTSCTNVSISGGTFGSMALFKAEKSIITGGVFKERGSFFESKNNTILGGTFQDRFKFPKMSNSTVFLHNSKVEDIKNPGTNNLFIINQIDRIKFEKTTNLKTNNFFSTNKPTFELPKDSQANWHLVDQKAFDDVIQELKIVTLKNLERAINIIESAALAKEEYKEL